MTKQHVNGHSVLPTTTFAEELLEHVPSLKAFARSLTKSMDRSEDLVQQTYMKALLKQDQYHAGTNLKAWLFTILRNECYSASRKRTRELPIDSAIIETTPDPRAHMALEEEQGLRQDFANVVPFLACITHNHCNAVIAVHYLGMTYEECALLFGVNIGTVKSRVNRAIAAINDLRESEEIETYDLSAWATATKEVPHGHPYFPIAKAYEDIYAYMVKNEGILVAKRNVSQPTESEVDRLYRQMRESGALEESSEDLTDLMWDDVLE